MGARLGDSLDHARTQALARHFHQAKTGNTTHLNTGTIIFQAILETFFNRVIVTPLVHINVVNHDKSGQIAQTQLTRDLVRGLEIGF